MATFKDEMKALAPELIDFEFASVRYPLRFDISSGGTFDPVGGQVTGGTVNTYNYQAIPKNINQNQWQNTDVGVSDLELTYTRLNDGFIPSVDSHCLFKSINYQVVGVKTDEGAEAVIRVAVRKL